MAERLIASVLKTEEGDNLSGGSNPSLPAINNNMQKLVERVKDVLKGKVPVRKARSSKWAKVRETHLESQPRCAVCEGNKKLSVHHIHPFHLYPELELEPSNLITLCESTKYGINCHLLIGHLGNFRNINTHVLIDITTWNSRLKERKHTITP